MTQKTVPTEVEGARILNGANWANNATAANLKDEEPSTKIIFDQSAGEKDTDRWFISNYLDGYKISNMGSGNWASLSGKQVLGVPDFDGQTCKWFIEYSGKNQDFWIREPKAGGLVWTIRPASAQDQTTVFLDPLNMESANQRVAFVI